MSRLELLNAGNFRLDGRRPLELRSLSLHLSPHAASSSSGSGVASSSSGTLASDPLTHPSAPDGSAEVCIGLTRVVAYVFAPRDARAAGRTAVGQQGQPGSDRASIGVEVDMAPWSSQERRRRSKADRRLIELGTAIRNSFEPVIQGKLYPRSQIDIYVHVAQDDGGVLSAALNATTLALIDAGIALVDFVVCVSVGLHGTSLLLDLCAPEESALPHLNLAVLARSGRVTLASLETRLASERLADAMRLAQEACGVLHAQMSAAVRARTRRLVLAEQKDAAAMVTAGAEDVMVA